MINRNYVINHYFTNLLVLNKIDKKLLQEIFTRNIKNKVELSAKFIRSVNYSKNIRIVDKQHKFFEEYKNLKIGAVNWFDSLSKSFKSYIGWYLQNKYMFERKNINNKVSDKIYIEIENKCTMEVVGKFYDDYLDDDGNVLAEVLQDYYFERKLPKDYYEKLFELYRYIIEEHKEDYLDDDGNIKSDLILDYCILGEKIPTSVNEKIRISVGRTKINFDALAKANSEKFKYFLTLTFADIKEKEKHIKLNENRNKEEFNLKFKYVNDISSLEDCNKTLNVFFTYLKQYMKKCGIEFYYLGCPEYHSNGHVHYHFLISDIPEDLIYDIPKWLDFDNVTRKFMNGKGIRYWKYGKSDIQEIKDEYKVTSYIAKYIEKSLDEIDGTIYFERLNKKRYYASNNLVKPEIKYESIEDYDFEFNSVYVKERKSSFNGNEIVDILYSI